MDKRIVVKIGTASLTLPNGRLDLRRIERLCWVLTDLRNQGYEVILVSSGAIAVGSDRLGLATRPRDILGKQAASAVGQAVLMQIYENFFMTYNQKVAQILLTRDVVENEQRKTNARNTFFTLLSMGVVPIVNENDTISTEELEFSDNDTLSSYVAILTDSDMLVILSDISGLYDKDPKKHSDAQLIVTVDKITDEITAMAGVSSTTLGTGGMQTKLNAAKMAMDQNIKTIIASGEDPAILFDIMQGKPVGTCFVA